MPPLQQKDLQLAAVESEDHTIDREVRQMTFPPTGEPFRWIRVRCLRHSPFSPVLYHGFASNSRRPRSTATVGTAIRLRDIPLRHSVFPLHKPNGPVRLPIFQRST